MIDWQGKRYWLVGASDGLGAALANVMSRAGVEVVVSARSEDKLMDVASSLPAKATYQALDVTDLDSIRAAAQEVGPVDGVIYLAGAYWPMKSSDWDVEKATTMVDVNLTGLIRLMGVVLPAMIERDAGHVVITSSLSAYRGLPGAIGYGASKAGTLSLAETMYAELKDTGVKVQVVNPGFIRTQMTDKNEFKMPAIMEPEDAAREMFEHMNTDYFKKSFPTLFSWVFRLGQFLPDWLYFRLFS